MQLLSSDDLGGRFGFPFVFFSVRHSSGLGEREEASEEVAREGGGLFEDIGGWGLSEEEGWGRGAAEYRREFRGQQNRGNKAERVSEREVFRGFSEVFQRF